MKISVLGDVMIDETVHVELVKPNPENTKGSVYRMVQRSLSLGGAGLTASLCARLKLEVEMLGVCGNDFYGGVAQKILHANHIFGLYRSDSSGTTIKTRYVAHGMLYQDRFDFEQIDWEMSDELKNSINSNLRKADNILVSDYGKGVVKKEFVPTMEKAAFYVVDPAHGVDWSFYGKAHLIKCNLLEAQTMLPKCNTNELASALFDKYRVPTVVTAGERGMCYCDDKTHGWVDAPEVKPCRIFGAGDAVIAALSLKLLEGHKLKYACEFASTFVGEQICQM